MNKINEILDYGLLSEFAYLKLENNIFKENNTFLGYYKGIPKNQISYRNKNNLINYIKGILINKNGEIITLEEDERYKQTDIKPYRIEAMINLLNRYKIIDFTSDDGYFSSDFQAMLLQNISTKEYVIAFRGTSSVKDGFVDVALANILGSHNYQENEAKDFIEDMIIKHNISKSNLTLCGHSLGGILAQTWGVKKKIKTYAYNPLGTSTLVYDSGSFRVNMIIELLDRLGIIDFDDEWINQNILTISYNDIGSLNGDILSNLATKLNNSRHLGMKIDFFGKDVDIGDGHSIISLNKLLEKQSKQNITTIEDLKNYNKRQKTMFFDIMIHDISIMGMFLQDNKLTINIQINSNIEDMISSKLAKNLTSKNIDIFRINSKITEQEDKDNFFNKLSYFPNNNKLKVKVKDFKDSNKLIIPFLDVNKELKKHRVITVLQGES